MGCESVAMGVFVGFYTRVGGDLDGRKSAGWVCPRLLGNPRNPGDQVNRRHMFYGFTALHWPIRWRCGGLFVRTRLYKKLRQCVFVSCLLLFAFLWKSVYKIYFWFMGFCKWLFPVVSC